MKQFVSRWYDQIVLKHSGFVIGLFVILLGLSVWQLPAFQLDASADSLLLEDDTDLAYYRELRLNYPSGDDFLIVTFAPRKGDVFAPKSLQLLKELSRELSALEAVTKTNSILNVPLLYHPQMSLTSVEKYQRTLESDDIDLAKARAEIVKHPFYQGQLIDSDATTTAIQLVLAANEKLNTLIFEREQLRAQTADQSNSERLAELDDLIDAENKRQVKRSEATIAQVRAILKQQETPAAQTFLGGVPMIVVDMVRFVQRDLQVFGGVVILFLVATLVAIFRDWRWVGLALISCLTTSILLTGFLSAVRFPITVISSNYISLIFIITLSMIIHLIVRFRELRSRYLPGGVAQHEPTPEHRSIVFQTVRQMFWPCVYTSLTTIVAFLSLMVSRIRPVIDFGLMMSLGICVAFVVAFVFFPALLSRFSKVSVGSQQLDNSQRAPFSLVFAKITQGLGHWLYVIVLAVAVFSVFGLSILSVENRFIDYFKADTEIHQGMKLIDRVLGGTTPLDVVVRFPNAANKEAAADDAIDERDCFVEDCSNDPQPSSLFSPQRMDLMRSAHQFLEGVNGVGKVLSMVSTLDVLSIANKGPLNGVEIELMDKMFPDDLRPLLIDPYVSPERGEFRFSLRIIDSDPDLVRADLIRKIETGLPKHLGLEPEQVKVAGMLKLYNNMLASLFDSQIRTMGFVFIAILIMVAILFRSIRLAVVALLPNILAGVFVLGLMGWVGVSLDIMTITIAAICVGMAVDNSIHYIYRFRQEYDLVQDYNKAMWRSHGSIGRALYYTSATIIVGFSILTLSSFKPTIYFGLFTSVAMCMALLGALTFLPRLMLTLRPLKATGAKKA